MRNLDRHDPKKEIAFDGACAASIVASSFGCNYGAGNGLLSLCCFEIRMEIELGISIICFFQKLDQL
jgi:hypothetical protein